MLGPSRIPVLFLYLLLQCLELGAPGGLVEPVELSAQKVMVLRWASMLTIAPYVVLVGIRQDKWAFGLVRTSYSAGQNTRILYGKLDKIYKYLLIQLLLWQI